MPPSRVYLIFAMLGLLIPWWFMGAGLLQVGIDPVAMFEAMVANPISTAVASDLFLSAFVFLCFVVWEGRGQGYGRVVGYLLATFLVGLSFALPLYLYFRAQDVDVYNGGSV